MSLARFASVVARLSHPNFIFQVGDDCGPSSPTRAYWLRVTCPEGADNFTGEPREWSGRKWRLSYHMTDGEIAQTALMAVLAAAEHEHRELFKVDGLPIFDPHYDLDALVRLRASEGAIKERDHHG